MGSRISYLGVLVFMLAAITVPYELGRASTSYPEVMFILDASGSMWGKAGPETKIEAAKQVMAKVVPALPKEAKVGLVAYGHRRKGDCSDVEVLIKAGSDDRDALLKKVQALSPKGMTPMASSVKQVADMIKGSEGETTIVLVSDGIETCHSDPCGVVKGLKESGIKFILHVVGFGVDSAGKQQLNCLAEAGGGKYFAARDADSLMAALETVKRDLAVKVEEAKTKEVKAKSRLGKLNVSLPESGLKTLDSLKIIRVSDNKLLKQTKAVAGVHSLLAGKYKVVLAFAKPNYRKPDDAVVGEYEVKGGEITNVNLGVVVINLAKGLATAADGVSIIDQATGKPFITHVSPDNDYYLMKPRPVPPGTYSVAFHYHKSPSPTIVAKDLKVTPGKETVATIDAGIAIKEASGVTGWDLVPSDKDKATLQVRRRFDNDYPLWKSFAVLPGTYNLYVLQKGMSEPLPVGEGIEVKRGETVVFDAGL